MRIFRVEHSETKQRKPKENTDTCGSGESLGPGRSHRRAKMQPGSGEKIAMFLLDVGIATSNKGMPLLLVASSF